jgi:hypothetical protein
VALYRMVSRRAMRRRARFEKIDISTCKGGYWDQNSDIMFKSIP